MATILQNFRVDEELNEQFAKLSEGLGQTPASMIINFMKKSVATHEMLLAHMENKSQEKMKNDIINHANQKAPIRLDTEDKLGAFFSEE